jgi:hypothetical protein
MASHSWDRLDHKWEQSEFDGERTDSEASDDDFDETGEAAGNLLMDMLLMLHYSGRLSAKSLCVICWWASRAGAASVSACALRPDSQSGHFQRKVDGAAGVNIKVLKAEMLTIGVPRYAKHDAGRSQFDMPVRAPHEVGALTLSCASFS